MHAADIDEAYIQKLIEENSAFKDENKELKAKLQRRETYIQELMGELGLIDE